MRNSIRLALLALPLAGLAVAACENTRTGDYYPRSSERKRQQDPGDRPGSKVFGEGGFNVFGGGASSKTAAAEQASGGGIGVNSYLWRASLDTVSFMPLSSADPFGGVIITDWYAPPETPGERFKVTIYILDRQLRADGIRVSVFKQRNAGAGWENAPVGENVNREMEDKILTRARELRIQSAQAR